MTSKKSCKFEKAILSSGKLRTQSTTQSQLGGFVMTKCFWLMKIFQLDSDSLKHVLDTIKGNSEVK